MLVRRWHGSCRRCGGCSVRDAPEGLLGGVDVIRTDRGSGGGFYYGAVSRTNQKSEANQSEPEGESLGRRFAPKLPTDFLSASGLSVYPQRGLCASPPATGRSARWVSADLDSRMMTSSNTAHRTPFDTFDTWRRLVSNEKTHDGAANLTHLTHLSTNRRGCTWRRCAGARVLGTHTPFKWCQMRQTRQIRTAVCRFFICRLRQIGCQFDTSRRLGVAR